MKRFAKRTGSITVIVFLVLGPTAAGAPSRKAFAVASTLDGKKVLPHRIQWLGLPALPAKKIEKVEFLIDGKLRWVESHAPYVYGGNSGAIRNYLVTAWLSPGRHHFTVRAVAVSGSTATDTVTTRVVRPPKVPTGLAGTWQRTISDTSGAPLSGSPGNPTGSLTPPGRYMITFDPRWIKDVFPCDTSPCRFDPKTGAGGELISDWTPRAGRFTVRGPVTIRIFHDTDRLGGFWCHEDGPSATYAWSVSGTTLTLAPVGGHDACGIRGFVWAGIWTRAG
jgi:hypothetical protein